MKALGATFNKYHSGWNRQQQRWIIRAAREVGLNVAAHLPYKMGRFDLSTIADGATTSEHDITYDTDLLEDAKQFLVSAGVSRSEESRVGKECVSTCRSRGSRDH